MECASKHYPSMAFWQQIMSFIKPLNKTGMTNLHFVTPADCSYVSMLLNLLELHVLGLLLRLVGILLCATLTLCLLCLLLCIDIL